MGLVYGNFQVHYKGIFGNIRVFIKAGIAPVHDVNEFNYLDIYAPDAHCGRDATGTLI